MNASIEEKLTAICQKVYHADGVVLDANAKKQLKQITDLGFDKLPICMAKTQYSFSDNASLLGAPTGFTVTVRNLKVCAIIEYNIGGRRLCRSAYRRYYDDARTAESSRG